MKTFGGWGYSPCILDLGNKRSSVASFTLRPFYRRTQWIGGWVGPRVGLDVMEKRKIPSSRRELNPRTPIFQYVASSYTGWATPALSDTSEWKIKSSSIFIFMRTCFTSRLHLFQLLQMTFTLKTANLRWRSIEDSETYCSDISCSWAYLRKQKHIWANLEKYVASYSTVATFALYYLSLHGCKTTI
jgi:hypothetical protein